MVFRSKIIIGAILFISIISVKTAFCEDYMQVQAAIDVTTVASDGKFILSQIADTARKNNISIVIPTDGFLNKWEYGLWPFRNIIKRTMEIRSVSKFGIRRYLDEIKTVGRQNPDMIFIPGLETGPFYYWQGGPFGKNFSIRDWHKHLLVIGLENEKDYKSLPVIGNGLALNNPFGIKGILLISVLISFLAAGLLLIREGSKSQRGIYARWHGLTLRQCKRAGILLVVISAGFLINSFPYSGVKYDQYHGDAGVVPYQNMINYVKARGGVTFWEHPEAKNIDKLGNISIETYEHTDLLLASRRYTGFAIFYEGYDRVGAPGCIWDEALKDYCNGIRPSPIWAIGALDFEKADDLDRCMKNLRTVFLLSHFSKADALNAMKEGRMYVSKEKDAGNFILDNFTVKDSVKADVKIMGQELVTSDAPCLTIAGHFIDNAAKSLKITIIRSGEIIKIMSLGSPFKIDYKDDGDIGDRKFYYRLEISSEGLFLVTNPIFVSRK